MKVEALKLTTEKLLREACEATTRRTSNMDLRDMYRMEHSPIRTQMFWVWIDDLPTASSVHFVRHKIGVEHFVTSNRPDRGGDEEANRSTPVNHAMLVNAEALVTMARKRLCYKASAVTRQAMLDIRKAVGRVDPDLAHFMVPNCVYRGGLCVESRPCGNYRVRQYRGVEDEQNMRLPVEVGWIHTKGVGE